MQQNLQDRLKQLVLALNWRMTNDTETRRKDFVLTWGGLALMLLALAYAIDPLKRFLHPPLFFAAAFLLGFAAWGFYARHIGGGIWRMVVAIPVGLIGLWTLYVVLERAVYDSQQTDRECALLQVRILGVVKPDAAAERTYELLQCRPQFDQRHPWIKDITSFLDL